MLTTRFIISTFMVIMLSLVMGAVSGQTYPSKVIHIVTGTVGGNSDFTARQIAQGITGPLGQPVVVDNRGSGVLPMEAAFKTAPDGYTLLLNGASIWILPFFQKTAYDPVKDFSPISLVSRDFNLLVVHPSVPAKSVKELIALAKARPGELNYASTTIAGPQYLGLELFKSMAGVNIVNVPYKGIAFAITGLISGEVQVLLVDPSLAMPHVKTGKLRALAVTGAQPTALVPGLPTVAGSGLPGYEVTGMTGIFAPAKTPEAIINRLNQEIVRFLNRTETKELFLNAGVEIVANSPDEFAAIIKSDTARTGKLLKDAGIKVE